MKIGREINFQSWTFRDSFFSSSNGSPCCIVHCLAMTTNGFYFNLYSPTLFRRDIHMNICVRGGLRVSKIKKDQEEEAKDWHCTSATATAWYLWLWLWPGRRESILKSQLSFMYVRFMKVMFLWNMIWRPSKWTNNNSNGEQSNYFFFKSCICPYERAFSVFWSGKRGQRLALYFNNTWYLWLWL